MRPRNQLKNPPKINRISSVILPEVHTFSIHSIPVYEIRKPESGLIMMEIVFMAGRPQEHKQMVSSCCAPMMREGAGQYDSETIAEKVDFYGASLSISADLDVISIKLICLKKYFSDLKDIVADILSKPHFSPKELKQFRERRIQQLEVELAKNDVVAYRTLTEAIYGPNHPYGYNSTQELYRLVTVEDLHEHFDRHICASKARIFLSGDLDNSDHEILASMLSRLSLTTSSTSSKSKMDSSPLPQRHISVAGNKAQTSLKIGRRTFPRGHKDFTPLTYVSTILGGYFGSRLISNIREKKGLTYGIYSTLDVHLHDGAFMISTEVANSRLEECIKEVYFEIERLQEEEVSDQELETVNNYLMGNYLNLFDGPFNSIRAIKSLVLAQIPLDSLQSLIKASISFDANDIIQISKKYLDRNDFWEVIVGP